MNLFTYLLSKKGKNSLVHKGDLFAYLLGKQTPKEVKTATGTTISITDATKAKIVSLILSKESTQDGTPTPENPVEIKTVKGYRNLFDKENINELTAQISTEGTILTSGNAKTLYIPITGGQTYSISKLVGVRFRAGTTENIPSSGTNVNNFVNNDEGTLITISSNSNDNYLVVYYYLNGTDISTKQQMIDSIQIVEGEQELPYVPYGTNWIYAKVSNGIDTNYYTIPLNNNEIAGIDDYKDELIIDSNGHCWLNKVMNKNMLLGEYASNYDDNYKRFILAVPGEKDMPETADGLSNVAIITTGNLTTIRQNSFIIRKRNAGGIYVYSWLDGIESLESAQEYLNNNDVYLYYPLATPQPIDLEYDVDIRLFNGVNNISNSDDMDMTLEYY